MPAEVKILVQGYTNANEVGETGVERNCPTITLVRDEDLIMVVDPGVLESQQILIDALAREDLTVNDVTIVCITHSHLDHYRNIGMFPKAKTLEYYGVWDKNTIEGWSESLTSNIHVSHTPGHDYTGITVFVTTDDGVVAICGDVFWRENYPRLPEEDAYASNPGKLAESREMVLKTADWIIPGHGPMYETDREVVLVKKETATPAKTKESVIVVVCKKCKQPMKQRDKCLCRPYLCFRCCECGYDCPTCGCSHKK